MSAPIIVGVDPMRHDPEAPVLAALIARATGASVVAVAAYPDAQLRGRALARLSAVEAAFHRVDLTTTAVPARSPAEALQRVAAAHGAGLIVVGSTHRGLSGRIALGRTADRLLGGSRCPVAVAPLGFAERMRGLDRVGVAFVESDEGYEAVRAAGALASACKAALAGATAVDPIAWSGASLTPPSVAEARADRAVADARARLSRVLDGAVSGPVTAEVLVGGAVGTLAGFSRDVDVLVCGSRGHGPLGSVLLGSVSRRLIHRAACPVIVVPRGTEPAFDALVAPPAVGEAAHA